MSSRSAAPRQPAPAQTQNRGESRTPQARRAQPYWFAVAIVLAGAWAFSNSLGGVFVLDDVRAIVRNPTIRTLWPVSTPLLPPSASTVAGRPVANLSFALNYAAAPADARDVFEPSPQGREPARTEQFLRNVRGYHLGNLAIHLAAALALFGVVRRTLLTPRMRPRFEAAAPWLAGAVAVLWVVHPLQTAAVTYTVQRVESLMGLFYLLTLYCAIRAEERPRSTAWTMAAVTACACGMGTKEIMVTVPLAVVAWDHVFSERRWSRPRLVLLAGLAATWVVTIVLVAGEQRAPSVSLEGATVWRYLITQGSVILHYLRLVAVPAPLAFLYDWPLATSLADAWLPVLVMVTLAAFSAVAFVRRHPAGFPAAMVFLVLAPSSSVLPVVTEVAAEHRMYLPLAGVIALVATGLFVAGRRVFPRGRVGLGLAGVAVLATTAWLGVTTRARNLDYASEELLWRTAVVARPSDGRARVAYGTALATGGRIADAETQLAAAVDMTPADPVAHVRLGSVLARQNKLEAAAVHFDRALALRPEDIDALRFLAEVRAIQRQDAQAVALYERVLRLLPGDTELSLRLAAVLADSRDPAVRDGARAVALADQAVRATGRRDARSLEILAAALGASARFAEASAAAREGAELARARGDARRADALEYRAGAYEYAAQQGLTPRR